MVCVHVFVFCFILLKSIITIWVPISHVFSSLFSHSLPQFQMSAPLFQFIPVATLLVVFSVLTFLPLPPISQPPASHHMSLPHRKIFLKQNRTQDPLPNLLVAF